MKPYYEHAGITIYHGDCRDVLPLDVDVVVTDIPYGISQKHGGLREIDYGDWDKDFDHQWVVPLVRGTPTLYLWCGQTQLSDLINEMRGFDYSHRCLAWIKPNPTVMNGQHLWLPSVEVCAFGRLPGATFNKHCAPGHWTTPPDSMRLHPTQKPQDMIADHIAASSNQGDLILDPFMGSGTTLRAAKDLGRTAIGIEIEERYCEIAAERLSQEVLPL